MQQTQGVDYWRELVFMLFSQRTLILGVTVLVFAASVAIVMYWPKQYEANSSILVRGKVVQGAIGELDSKEGNKVLPVSKEDIYSELQLLSSTELAARTADHLHAQGAFQHMAKAELADYIHRKVKFDVLPATNVIEVHLRGEEPEQLKIAVDGLLDAYVRFRLSVYQPADSFEFFDQQTEALQKELEEYEMQLIQLVEENNSPEPDKEIEANLVFKRDLMIEQKELQDKLIDLRSELEQLKDPDHAQTVRVLKLSSPAMEQVLERRVDLELQRGELLRTYQKGSKKLAELDRELASNNKLILTELRQHTQSLKEELAANEAKLDGVSKRLEALDQRNLTLQASQVMAQRIQREIELKQSNYESFARRREEARISQAMDHSQLSSHVTIMERAWSEPDPVFPSPMLAVAGLITGFMLGMTLALIREFLDHSFKKPADVNRVTHLPVICSLPVLKPLELGKDN